MKKFTDYLVESEKTYEFKLKVAGDLPEGFNDRLKTALEKYSVVNISSAKKTPIQESPLDFPNLQNMEVHHIEFSVKYPTTSHVLQSYLGEMCSVPASHLRVRAPGEPTEEYQEKIDDNNTYETLLGKEDLGGESAQDSVGENRVMDLLKELEKARSENEYSPVANTPVGESSDIADKENEKSVVGN